MIREEINLLVKYIDSLDSSKLNHVSGYERRNQFFMLTIGVASLSFGYPDWFWIFGMCELYVVDSSHNNVEVRLSYKESRLLYKCYYRTLRRAVEAQANAQYLKTQELLRSAVKPLVIATFNNKANQMMNEDDK